MKRARAVGIQYAALPWRLERGHVRILLITSRQTGRWVIPKGWPMTGLKPQEAAAAEAAEEAGLVGETKSRPIGSYRYLKRLKDDDVRAVQVIVFPLEVQAQVDAWKEQHQRACRWFSHGEAAARVAEPALQRLIRDFAAARTPSFFAQRLRRYRSWRFGAG